MRIHQRAWPKLTGTYYSAVGVLVLVGSRANKCLWLMMTAGKRGESTVQTRVVVVDVDVIAGSQSTPFITCCVSKARWDLGQDPKIIIFSTYL